MIAVCESDLEAEVINQMENWKEQIPAVVIVVLPDIDGCGNISLASIMNPAADTTVVKQTKEEGECPLQLTKSKRERLMQLMTIMTHHPDDDEDGEQEENTRAKVLAGYKALCECVRLEGGWVWSQKVFPVEKLKSVEDVGIAIGYLLSMA